MHRVVIDLDKQALLGRGLPGRDRDPAQRGGPARRGGRRSRRSSKGKSALREHAAGRARRSAIRRRRRSARPRSPATTSRTARASPRATRSPARPSRRKGKAKGWVRALRADKGIKFKEIWVQHRDESATKGQVAIYFFPTGASEKAVIELTDGTEIVQRAGLRPHRPGRAARRRRSRTSTTT